MKFSGGGFHAWGIVGFFFSEGGNLEGEVIFIEGCLDYLMGAYLVMERFVSSLKNENSREEHLSFQFV